MHLRHHRCRVVCPLGSRGQLHDVYAAWRANKGAAGVGQSLKMVETDIYVCYISVYLYIYTHMYVHIHTYIHTCTYIYIHIHKQTHTHTHIYTYMRTCMHAYIQTYIHTIYINNRLQGAFIRLLGKPTTLAWALSGSLEKASDF